MNFWDTLQDTLSTYFHSTDISLSVINDLGNEIISIGGSTGFCKFFRECTDELCPCSQTHLYAGKQAEKLGEAYIFSCPAGLIHYTVPLIKDDVFKGSILAGPVLLEFPDGFMVDDIIQKFNLHINMRGKISSTLRTVPVIEPSKVTHLSKLLYTIVCSVLREDMKFFSDRNHDLTQQPSASSGVQELEPLNHDTFYPYDDEKELLQKVKNGDIIGAKTILNDLLGHIFFSSSGNMEVIKMRTLELCTLLSRASVEGGADLNKIFDINGNFLSQLNKIHNLEDLSYWIKNILDQFTQSAFKFADSKNSALIQKCISIINENFKNNLTLDTVSNMVHLNSSYFSSLFKKEVGVSFSSYLNKVRIDESMQLLKNTDWSILEIALEVGFEDHSYFSKVFKNLAGVTPKEYKQRLP